MTIKAVFFDLVGTCLDWYSTIIDALPSSISEEIRSDFMLDWHQAVFEKYAKLVEDNVTDPLMLNNDAVYWQTLGDTLHRYEQIEEIFNATPEFYDDVIAAWHELKPWDDVAAELQHLRDFGLQLYVSANGSTRRQLDQARFAMLQFDMLFSSELVGAFKPSPEPERIALHRLGLQPDEVVMVASHVEFLRGAKELGMQTVYVHRWEDDIGQDQQVREDHDAYLEEGMQGLAGVIREWMDAEDDESIAPASDVQV